MQSPNKSAQPLPPPHAVVLISVKTHDLSYSLSRDGEQIREEKGLTPNPDTFFELAAWCLRGGFFDVRVVPECNNPAVQDMCAVACNHYDWSLQPCA